MPGRWQRSSVRPAPGIARGAAIRVWPVVLFWVVVLAAFTVAQLGRLWPVLLIAPMPAAYLVARYGPQRHVYLALLPVVPFTLLWLGNDGPWWDAVMLSGLFAGCLLFGRSVALRRDYVVALEDRARSLERLSLASERNQIAREMHDIVAHNLAVMVALADGAVASARSTPDTSMDLMTKVSATGRHALGEVRQLIGLLREEDTGAADVEGLVDQVRAAGLPVKLVRDGSQANYGPAFELAVYRIVQEALTNTMKHAGQGAAATVRLSYHPDGVEIEVNDNGQRPVPVTAGGHGLTGLRERAAAYGGAVVAGPKDDGGWRVATRLRVPA